MLRLDVIRLLLPAALFTVALAGSSKKQNPSGASQLETASTAPAAPRLCTAAADVAGPRDRDTPARRRNPSVPQSAAARPAPPAGPASARPPIQRNDDICAR